MAALTPSVAVVAVVDDDPLVLESLEDLLESADHTVRLFASATAFLESGQLAEIDCVISDIGMPAIDGFELRRLAKVARPELPVILITGRDELANPPRGASLPGAHEVFQKPFNGQELLAAVNKAVCRSLRKK
jgi:FixJ family two-component response regulator